MTSDRAEMLAVVEKKTSEFGFAERMRLFQYRIEYWHKLAGRGIDDLQHLCGRGLLL